MSLFQIYLDSQINHKFHEVFSIVEFGGEAYLIGTPSMIFVALRVRICQERIHPRAQTTHSSSWVNELSNVYFKIPPINTFLLDDYYWKPSRCHPVCHTFLLTNILRSQDSFVLASLVQPTPACATHVRIHHGNNDMNLWLQLLKILNKYLEDYLNLPSP